MPSSLEVPLSALSLCLLRDIVLGTTLPRLASVMLMLVLGLLAVVAGKTSNRAANRAGDAVSHARCVVADLALGLLLLSLEVLLAAGLLQVLCHMSVSHDITGRAMETSKDVPGSQ